MNSWDKGDSGIGCDGDLCKTCGFKPDWCGNNPIEVIGNNDHSLIQRLSNAGTDHRKFMRMMLGSMDMLVSMVMLRSVIML